MAAPRTTHDDQTGTTRGEAPALASAEPIGAREPVAPPWVTRERRARRWRTIACVAAVIAVAAVLLTAVVWNAETHYRQGRDALARGEYATAVEEFAAARLFVIPYRDAEALRAKADRSLAAVGAAAAAQRRREAKIERLLEKAGDRLTAGDTAGVAAAVAAARDIAPNGSLAVSTDAGDLVSGLARRFRDTIARRLEDGRWGDAERLASAWLTVEPASEAAASFLSTARDCASLQTKLDSARAAAANGRWHAALRIALAVLDRRAGFPGAATLVAQARTALAPAATTSGEAAATSSSGSSSTSSGASSTSSGSTPAPP